jgi:hypothetical protein
VAHDGAELGAACLDLWEAGHYELKPLARTFDDAARRIDNADGALLLHRGSELSGPYGPVLQAWSDLRDDVFAILRETAANLDLTGDALLLAAREHLRSDRAARDAFHRLRPDVVAAHPEREPPS